MCYANNEKRETINDGRNRTTISRKDQNARRNWNWPILGNIGSGHDQTIRDEGKKFKKYHKKSRKILETKLFSRKFIKGMYTWSVLLSGTWDYFWSGRRRNLNKWTRERENLLWCISDVLLGTPAYGQSKAGRPARTFIQQLCDDTGCNPEVLPKAMNDRETWRERVRNIRVSRTWWWW